MNLYGLRSSNACRKRRAFAYKPQAQAEDNVIKSNAMTRACVDMVFGRDAEEVKQELHEVFQELTYPTEITRNAAEDQAWREIVRYVNGEMAITGCTRRQIDGRYVDIGVYEDVFVNPHFVRVFGPYDDYAEQTRYDGAIDIVRLHTGKPRGARSVNTDLEKYAMLKFARTLVSPGKSVRLTVSDVYLKRADDAGSDAKTPNFAEDFWEKGGNNIISLHEKYIGGTELTERDVEFKGVVAAFNDGHDAEDCTKTECEQCPLYDICHYAEPPIRMSNTAVKRSLRDVMLTDSQNEAIEYERGVVRINAGAGVGKTVVVALRTVTLLNKGVRPEEILLMTFTNAGAEEMRTRIQLYNEDVGTGEDISAMKICTFNSFGDDILKVEYPRFGFSEPPKVVDDVERASIITRLLQKKIIDGLNYERFYDNTQYVKGAVWIASRVFDIVKKGPYTAQDVDDVIEDMGEDASFIKPDKRKKAVLELIQMYDEYDAEMRSNNLIEFADQEMMLFELLMKEPYYLEQYGYKHIIIDEFQDTNLKQVELLRILLSAPHCESLMVVGDDSQAIFSFRDTSPEYIINFRDHIGEDTDDIFLLENHRCTPQIITFANAINAKNKHKVAKDLIATRPNGSAVTVQGFHTAEGEENYIINGVKKHIANGTKPEDIAIICGTKHELRRYADKLTKEGIASVSLNPEPLHENSRVKAATSFVRALSCDTDTMSMLIYVSAKEGGVLFDKTELEIEALIEDVRNDILAVNDIPDDEKKDALMKILVALDHNDDEIYQKFLEVLSRKTYEQIVEYCNNFLIFGLKNEAKREHSYPGVVLTTCHSSKGLEWPVVYASLSSFDAQSKNLHVNSSRAAMAVEEMRRLLFVTATRARDELYITGKYVAYGKKPEYVYNQFLKDAYACNGQTFCVEDIAQEAEQISKENSKRRAAERKLLAERMKQLKKEANLI